MHRKWMGLIALLVVASCAPPDDGLSTKDAELANRSDEIVRKAGGNWDGLSAEDKEYLIREIGYGDEKNARMFFEAKSGNLKAGPKGTPGGPPRTGGPAPQ